MGWVHSFDGRHEHEGHAVAYAPGGWVPSTATSQSVGIFTGRDVHVLSDDYARPLGPFRELGTLEADDRCEMQGLLLVGAACGCGWRSPRVKLSAPVRWFPSMVECDSALAERLTAMWRRHVEDECGAAAPKRLLTSTEYYALVDAGVIDPEERNELLSGEIVPRRNFTHSELRRAYAAGVFDASGPRLTVVDGAIVYADAHQS